MFFFCNVHYQSAGLKTSLDQPNRLKAMARAAASRCSHFEQFDRGAWQLHQADAPRTKFSLQRIKHITRTTELENTERSRAGQQREGKRTVASNCTLLVFNLEECRLSKRWNARSRYTLY